LPSKGGKKRPFSRRRKKKGRAAWREIPHDLGMGGAQLRMEGAKTTLSGRGGMGREGHLLVKEKREMSSERCLQGEAHHRAGIEFLISP